MADRQPLSAEERAARIGQASPGRTFNGIELHDRQRALTGAIDCWVSAPSLEGIHHLRFVNPPLLVPDPAGTIVRGTNGRYREDPAEALRQVITEAVRVAATYRHPPETTTTLFSGTADGYLEGTDASTYAAAAAAADTVNTGDTIFSVGQEYAEPTYNVRQAFVPFDTSSIPETDTISAVTLSFQIDIDHSDDREFLVEVYAKDFGASVDTGDWITSWGALTLLASFDSTSFATGVYNDMTSESAFLDAIDTEGTTRLAWTSDQNRLASAPPGSPSSAEWVEIFSADDIGTSQDPKLVIEHTPPIPTLNIRGGRPAGRLGGRGF